MRSNVIFIIVVFSMILISCKNNTNEVIESDSELIEITKAQFETENMEFGEPFLSPFSDMVHFTGTIIPSVNGRAEISLPVPGMISKIYCKPGQYITKGALIFEVTGNEFIDMQKDFAESSSQLIRLKSDFERVKELSNDNIVSKKDYLLAESAYNSEKAKFNALKIKLENIGLDISQIEGSKFYASYSLKSPIKGYVSGITATIGQYIEIQQRIAEIIDNQSFQLMVSVFEKDINEVKAGQHVKFYSASNKSVKYSAKISTVGKIISDDTKSISCFADIKNLENTNFVSNQFIEGEIIIDTDSVLSVPETSILKSEDGNYVLMLEKETDENYYFKKSKVTTGRINNNYIEIIDIPESGKIVINGIYNILVE